MSEENDFGVLLYYGLAAFIAIAAWALIIRLGRRKPQFSLSSLLALTFIVAMALAVAKLALSFWA